LVPLEQPPSIPLGGPQSICYSTFIQWVYLPSKGYEPRHTGAQIHTSTGISFPMAEKTHK
jgi:hypothetical protein